MRGSKFDFIPKIMIQMMASYKQRVLLGLGLGLGLKDI